MGYDSWENVGYKIIDKINSFDTILTTMRDDIKDIKKTQSKLQIKMWAIGVVSAVVISLGSKFLAI